MIGLLNSDLDLKNKLGVFFETYNFEKTSNLIDIDGLFVDWISKDLNPDDFPLQAAVVDNYAKKGIPIILFDRHFSINEKEYQYLKGFNVAFFEPAIKYRKGFEWMPHWFDPDDKIFEYQIDECERQIDLMYDGFLDDRLASFEKYYTNYSQLFPEKNVCFMGIWGKAKTKKEKYEGLNIKTDITSSTTILDQINFTVLIGSKKEYNIGYLRPDLFHIMSDGICPLLPIEHRFFGSMFQELVVKDESEVSYFVDCGKDIRREMIDDIFKNAFVYYPEFNLNYTIERIKDFFEV